MAPEKFSAEWTTAHQLQKDCYFDDMPKDPEVRKDYGFDAIAASQIDGDIHWGSNFDLYTDEQKLLGLFQGLLKTGYLGVDPLFLDQWRREGTLVKNITRTFERGLLPDKRGGYYPWFVGNRSRFEKIWSEGEGARGSSLRSTKGGSVRVNQTQTSKGANHDNAAAKKDDSSNTSPLRDNKDTGGGDSDFSSNFKKNLRGAFE